MKHISEIMPEALKDLFKDKDINQIYQDAIIENQNLTSIVVDGVEIPICEFYYLYGHLVVRRSHCSEYLELIEYGLNDNKILNYTGWSVEFLNKVKNNRYVISFIKKYK